MLVAQQDYLCDLGDFVEHFATLWCNLLQSLEVFDLLFPVQFVLSRFGFLRLTYLSRQASALDIKLCLANHARATIPSELCHGLNVIVKLI